MKKNTSKKKHSSWQTLLLVAVVLLAGTLMLMRAQTGIEQSLIRLKKDFQIDQDLAQHKEEHVRVYEGVLQNASIPEARPLDQTSWIQLIQEKS